MTIVLAVPAPISFISIIGSIISIANINILAEASILLSLSAIIAMLFASTYWITYIASTVVTFRNGKLSLAPIFHLAIFGVFFALWIVFENIFM